MALPKRSIESSVTIDGVSLVWRLHREQQWSTDDGWRGMAIHVKNAQGARRGLHLEYPPVNTEKGGFTKIEPGRPGIIKAKVEADIREAITAGWDPESRGKPYVCEMAEPPH
jgi:hypothetical protein